VVDPNEPEAAEPTPRHPFWLRLAILPLAAVLVAVLLVSAHDEAAGKPVERRHGTFSPTCSDRTSGVMLQTRTSYGARPSRSRTTPNTAHGVARSASTTPSKATTATRCRRRRRFGVNPADNVFLATGGVCHVS